MNTFCVYKFTVEIPKTVSREEIEGVLIFLRKKSEAKISQDLKSIDVFYPIDLEKTDFENGYKLCKMEQDVEDFLIRTAWIEPKRPWKV